MPRNYLLKEYRYTYQPDLRVSKYSTRNRRQRNLYPGGVTTFNFSEHLSQSEFSDFKSWVSDDLSGGASNFNGDYWVSSIMKTGDMHIINGQYSYSYLSPDLIRVSYQAELIERDHSDGQALYESLNAGVPNDSSYLFAVEDAINNGFL